MQQAASVSSVSESEIAQLCPTLFDPVDCSLPGSSIHGIVQARILEWVAISFSRGSSQLGDWTRVSCIAGRHFNLWATRETLVLSLLQPKLMSLISAHYFHIYISFSTPLQKYLRLSFRTLLKLTKDNVTYLNNLTQTCAICQWTNPNSNIRPTPFPTHQIADIFLHKTGR